MKRQKKSEYIDLYININKCIYIYINIWETDGHEVRLVEGRVGAGELIHWPLSLGWLSCCHSVPWWAFDLPHPPPSSSHLHALSPYSGHPPPFFFSGGLIPTLAMPKHFHEQGVLEEKTSLEMHFFFKSPFGLYWAAAVAVHPVSALPDPLDAHSSTSTASVAGKQKTHW